MREHQIVITLKPDQFLEVQRQARSAKAKSMGIFVRQKLLAALGIEGLGENTTIARRAPELDNAVADLRRVHRELKEFVAESLSRFGDTEPDVVEADERPVVAPEAEFVDAPSSADEIEDMARSTFAISPRLGVIEPWTAPPADEARAQEPSAPIVRDPLAELLAEQGISLEKLVAMADEGEADEDEADDEGDEYNVPRSLQERRRQLAQTTGEDSTDDDTAPVKGAGPAAQPDAVTVAEVEDFDDDTALAAAADDSSVNQGGDQSGLGNPPFSGGPPPKKR